MRERNNDYLAFYRPDALSVWFVDLIKERLNWYYSVMRDLKPAKFLIVKRVGVDANPYDKSLSTEELWRLHDDAVGEFLKIFSSIRRGELRLGELNIPKYSLLDVKVELAKRLMEECSICERRCSARRLEGVAGVCLMANECIVHSYFHHIGEEAPLVPSGTIFYGGCNFKCVFCQNWDISQVKARSGLAVSTLDLARIQAELRRSGARNINHVGGDPTPHLAFILESLKYLDVNAPQLWNSNMYLTVESMKILKDVIDIWLPDFKYGSNACAERLSKAQRYFEVASRNHLIAYESGEMIIRHLVLPNHIECCTKPVLKWISENTPRAVVNIMDQYRPEHIVLRSPDKYPDVSRRLKYSEISEAYRYAEEVGFKVHTHDLWLKP
ncbi:MAG: radical SAM protein [Desulfurococcaceae archaeon]|nr:radical SAM protein [Sulfolobales archaeon]MDW8170669.1 radical SAM protein [Desulfurococcaceae archaeon]